MNAHAQSRIARLHRPTSRLLVALLVALLPAAVVGDDTGKARIVTGHSQAAQCISPVQVRKIDGEEVKVQALGFDLEPGTHTLWGSARIDASTCPASGIGSNRHSPEPIEAEFEAGKTYYLGFDHKSSNRRDWKFVIWKVVDVESEE